MKFLIILVVVIPAIYAHSWMSCPPSFVTTLGRGGVQDKGCESNGNGAFVTTVHAGDRLKVGWVSNNHAGGYVRLSLVKFGDHWGDNQVVENNFKSNVLKFVCYGHNKLLGGNNGDCNHPCDARGGCNYQADQYDIERYDTTIGIPTNLPEGLYVLQASLLVGNSMRPYYSCAKINILKGNPSLNCISNGAPLVYSCEKTGGPALATHFLRVGARKGHFCYHYDGRIGTTDDHLRDVPINVECDPRVTCDNAIHKSLCQTDAPDMAKIRITSQGTMPGCYVYDTIPPPIPRCDDGLKNGDESGVDCGGQFCKDCPLIVKPGLYHGKITQKVNSWATGGNFDVSAEITKTIADDQCWQLILQYNHPIDINSMWGDGKLVSQNNQKTIITIQKPSKWAPNPTKGTTLKIHFGANNPKSGEVIWNQSSMELQGATTLYVSKDCS